jgi:saccharopine dehydrogenase-like NADP-dependent oxidoreductase
LAVLIVGATGVFGSRLARLAAGDPGVRLTLGGRRRAALEALAAELGRCAVQTIDRDDVTVPEVERFDLVVDCAGPFQGSATRLIEQCIAARVDYVDLADGREWVCSIDRFDAAARRAGVAVVTGASSIPALSHAVLDHLTHGWTRIDSIRIGIFPGNRAPRGRSVARGSRLDTPRPYRLRRGRPALGECLRHTRARTAGPALSADTVR